MSYWSGSYHDWAPRKTAAERRADAVRKIQDAARKGRAMSPITIAGRKIAHTFWGKAWCDNLERYRDFAYRLERGRSYVRSGSVIDLRIEAGKILATVSGSSLYSVAIEIDAVQHAAWRAIQRDCAGSIGSRIDLLSGQLSEPVMARLCADRTGLFPAPAAIRFTCSCPDYATMCKHVAAVMYGVGARLDYTPDLLFTLRKVSADELLASAISELPAAPAKGRVLAADGLAALFGIELAEPGAQATGKPAAPGQSKPARAAAGNSAATVNAKPAGRAAASSSKTHTRSAAQRAPRTAASVMKPAPQATQPALQAMQPALQAKKSAPQAKKVRPTLQAEQPATPAKKVGLAPTAKKVGLAPPAKKVGLAPTAKPPALQAITPPLQAKASAPPAKKVGLAPPAKPLALQAKTPALQAKAAALQAKAPAPPAKTPARPARQPAPGVRRRSK